LVLALVFLLLSVAIAFFPIERTMIGTWRVSATDPMRPLRLAALAAGWFVVRLLSWPGVKRAGRAVRRAARLMGLAFTAAVVADKAAGVSTTRDRARSWGRGAAAGAIAGAFVFLWIYGPVMLDHRGFSPEEIRGNLMAIDPVSWHDWAAIGRDVFVYDSVRPFALLGVAIALVWWPMFRVPADARRFALVSLALSVFVWVVALRLGNFSIWGGIAGLVPGMSGIRDPKRVIYLYELAVPCVIGLLVARARARRTVLRSLIAAACLVILVADWHTRSFAFSRTREVFDHWVSRPIAVDSSCRSFFVTGASEAYLSRSDHLGALFAMDAAFISLRTGIPTLNGYSAWAPPGWDLSSPHDARYMTRVREWIARHRLTGVCALDLGARTMTPFQ
jgi:hypothetical protein